MLWICVFLLCPPLSVPRLPHPLSSWMMGSRGLAFSESWANLHEKLSHLHCPRKGYKRQLSPAAGDKVCLSKAGARVYLRHQDKVWTPAPFTCCLQHRIHRDPQPPAPGSTCRCRGGPGAKRWKGPSLARSGEEAVTSSPENRADFPPWDMAWGRRGRQRRRALRCWMLQCWVLLGAPLA